MFSFWEKKSLLYCDIAIVGSGLVGLSTGISILERYPNKRVYIFDKNTFPSGASTKNAGFACFGSPTEIISDINSMGKDVALDLVHQRWLGLQQLKSRVPTSIMDYEDCGGFEIFNKNVPTDNQIESLNEDLEPIFDKKVFSFSDRINEFGFDKSTCKSMIYNSFEGSLNPAKLVDYLVHLFQKLGGRIFTNTEVNHIEQSEKECFIEILDSSKQTIQLKTNQFVICNNAWANQFMELQKVTPGRGQVIITKPIPNLKFKGTFHIEEGYFYYRNVGNRVLLGGGRHLAFDDENTYSQENTDLIITHLIDLLKTTILPQTPFEIEHQWSGTMAFGENKQPIIQKISKNGFIACKMSGMGVAMSSKIGEDLAEIVSHH